MKYYPSFLPSFSQSANKVLMECLETKSISGNYGSAIKKLENTYGMLHNNHYAVSCSNGTTALHLACLGLQMNSTHTVVVPSTTNMATFFAPMYTGAKVISCDVNKESGLIDYEELENICKEEKVDFVIVVHLYGHVVNPLKINRLAKKYHFQVIEDCAEAHFARYEKNQGYVGSYHDASCFSFYANKIISGGEGGIVLFKSESAAALAKNLKNLSFGDANNSPSKFYHSNIGFNYRLANTIAALICDSLDHKDEILSKRDLIVSWYSNILREKNFIETIYSDLESFRVNWVYCIKIKENFLTKFKSKTNFLRELSLVGIEARDFFYPAELQPFFKEYCLKKRYINKKNINALEFYKGSIYLPVYMDLSEKDIKDICNRLELLLI